MRGQPVQSGSKRCGLLGKIIEPDSLEARLYVRSPCQDSTPNLSSGSWRLNQQCSPLLRLPPELRSLIYDYVLAGHHIHVLYRPWVRRWRKKNFQRFEEVTRGGFHCQTTPDPRLRPSKSMSRRLQQRGFTLLSPVCRQLYRETPLIPYQRNVWSFENYYVLNRYVLKENRLPLLQRRAIRSVMYPFDTTKALMKYLGGVEEVVQKTKNGLEIKRLSKPEARKRERPKNMESCAQSKF